MKTELRPVVHSLLARELAIELWHDGQLIGTVYGADGPGIRLISKHPAIRAMLTMEVSQITEIFLDVNTVLQ